MPRTSIVDLFRGLLWVIMIMTAVLCLARVESAVGAFALWLSFAAFGTLGIMYAIRDLERAVVAAIRLAPKSADELEAQLESDRDRAFAARETEKLRRRMSGG